MPRIYEAFSDDALYQLLKSKQVAEKDKVIDAIIYNEQRKRFEKRYQGLKAFLMEKHADSIEKLIKDAKNVKNPIKVLIMAESYIGAEHYNKFIELYSVISIIEGMSNYKFTIEYKKIDYEE